jgi:hypothetical protein
VLDSVDFSSIIYISYEGIGLSLQVVMCGLRGEQVQPENPEEAEWLRL